MGNIKYYFKRIKAMDKKAMFRVIDEISKKTGKNKVYLFFDIIWCGMKHGAGYSDYNLFEMYNLKEAQRKTYLTRRRNNDLIKKYNKAEAFDILENKERFNTEFQSFLYRSWIKVNPDNFEEVKKWIKEQKRFLAKPIYGGCGHGIEKLEPEDLKDAKAIDEMLKRWAEDKEGYILEEIVIQNEEVSKVYPCSINTIRTVTLLKEGKPYVVQTYFRIGNEGRFVDNFNSGGMTVPIDVKTGVVLDKAIDKKKNLYDIHPYTGYKIKGFKFPYWEEVIQMAKELSVKIPDMGYVGWDIALTKDGPVIIEANEYPGHDIYQLPEHTPNKIGVYPSFLNPEEHGK